MIPMIPGLSTALLLITAVVCVLLVLSIIVGRIFRTDQSRRESVRLSRVRPLVLNIFDGETEFDLRGRDRRALVALSAEMAGQVRGDDRRALTSWLSTQRFDRECLKQMRSPFPLTRAQALSRFAPMAHLAPRAIERMLSDKNVGVRSLAAQIAGLSGASIMVPALLHSIQGTREIPPRIVSMAVLRTAPTSISDFGGTTSDSNDRVRALAIDLAGQLNLVDARSSFEAGLESRSDDVRAASIRAIQRLGSPLSIPALERMSVGTQQEHLSAQAVIREIRGG
jgi:hypothetical protein